MQLITGLLFILGAAQHAQADAKPEAKAFFQPGELLALVEKPKTSGKPLVPVVPVVDNKSAIPLQPVAPITKVQPTQPLTTEAPSSPTPINTCESIQHCLEKPAEQKTCTQNNKCVAPRPCVEDFDCRRSNRKGKRGKRGKRGRGKSAKKKKDDRPDWAFYYFDAHLKDGTYCESSTPLKDWKVDHDRFNAHGENQQDYEHFKDGIFTAPYKGAYHCCFSIRCSKDSDCKATLSKNGRYKKIAAIESNGQGQGVCVIDKLRKGESLQVNLESEGEENCVEETGEKYTKFSCTLVSPF